MFNNYTMDWYSCWTDRNLFWEMHRAPPETVRLVKEKVTLRDDVTAGRGLVPGMGSGHDAFVLAGIPRMKTVVGLDLSPLAVTAAQQLLETQAVANVQVEFMVADFFQHAPEIKYDVILDHTFLCAIEPSRREEWASKISSLLVEGGILITYMFPLGSHQGGPPFALSVDTYLRLLSSTFDLEYIKDVEQPFHLWKKTDGEKIAIWRRNTK